MPILGPVPFASPPGELGALPKSCLWGGEGILGRRSRCGEWDQKQNDRYHIHTIMVAKAAKKVEVEEGQGLMTPTPDTSSRREIPDPDRKRELDRARRERRMRLASSFSPGSSKLAVINVDPSGTSGGEGDNTREGSPRLVVRSRKRRVGRRRPGRPLTTKQYVQVRSARMTNSNKRSLSNKKSGLAGSQQCPPEIKHKY